MWRGFAPNENLHENATYLRKCKSVLQSHKAITNSAFTPFWKAGQQTNVMNGSLGLRDHMEMIIFSLTTYSSGKTTFCSMAMRKSATQICSLINHLEEDIDKLWIFFCSRLILVAQKGSLVTSLHKCNKKGSMENMQKHTYG